MTEGYWYIDSRMRDVFVIPNFPVGINSKNGLEVILEPKKLKWWDSFFKRKRRYISENLVYRFKIPNKETAYITNLCFNKGVDRAKEYLIGFFQGVMINERNRTIGGNDNSGEDFKIDRGGYDRWL